MKANEKCFFFLHCFSLSLSFFSLSFSLLATASSSFSRLLLSNVFFFVSIKGEQSHR